ncbi:MAG: PIN domain-containing protein [Gammaproteobacteria bacterium]|nr:PIN domain-containing protein [Gammaproteobacteria bacterium]
MILVDTSIWIDHFRNGDTNLITLLQGRQVLVHPFIIGELACGNLTNRVEILSMLSRLPQTKLPGNDEVLYLIEENSLMGKGIGFIDAHLIAATRLTQTALIWTRDKRLSKAASSLGFAYEQN